MQSCEFDKLFETYDSLIFMDTETTGLDPSKERIIELAAIKVIKTENGMRIDDCMDEYVRLPENQSLSPFIVDLTGITDDVLEQKGKKETLVAQRFLEMFGKGERSILSTYNIPFDIGFFFKLLERNNMVFDDSNIDYLDPLTICRDRKSRPHKLSDAISYYKIGDKVKNSHRAMDDVEALYEVSKAMAQERDDLEKYVNLLGFIPKYGPPRFLSSKIMVKEQPYNPIKKLYE